MSRTNYINVIDVGSSNVKTVIVQLLPEEKPRIVGVGVSNSSGMRKGVVVDLEEVTHSIEESIEKAEGMAGVEIKDAFIAIGGNHLKCFNTQGVIAIGRADGEVAEEDVERVIEASQAINIPHNYTLLHVVPQNFILDNQQNIKDPVGMNGVRLEMQGAVILGFTPYINNISKCFSNLNIGIDGFIVSPLAAAKSVLNKRQKELGVALVDIGGETTSLAVYEERELLHLAVIPIGASHITNDIAIGLRTSIDVAEKIKIEYGTALLSEVDDKEQINLAEIDKEEEGVITRKHVAEIIEARLEEIFFIIEKELKKINRSALLPAGAVIVGGGAKTQGTVDLAKETLKLPAQVGFPQELSGLIDKVDNPSFAVVIGMILWSLEEGTEDFISLEGQGGSSQKKKFSEKLPNYEIIDNVKKWFGKFLP